MTFIKVACATPRQGLNPCRGDKFTLVTVVTFSLWFDKPRPKPHTHHKQRQSKRTTTKSASCRRGVERAKGKVTATLTRQKSYRSFRKTIITPLDTGQSYIRPTAPLKAQGNLLRHQRDRTRRHWQPRPFIDTDMKKNAVYIAN